MELIAIALIGFIIFKIGGLKKITSLGKKSEAAASVQMLLEHQAKFGFFQGSPVSAATEYVQNAWDEMPAVFNGDFGQRPHKLSAVVYALALASKKLSQSSDENTAPVLIALGNALSEVEANGSFYPLTDTDHALIAESLEIFTIAASKEAS